LVLHQNVLAHPQFWGNIHPDLYQTDLDVTPLKPLFNTGFDEL